MKKIVAGISGVLLLMSAIAYANSSSTKKADCCAKAKSCCYQGSPCCNK